MKEKELKNIPGLKPEDVVVIKKRNYGLDAKYSAAISEITYGGKGQNAEMKANIEKAKIYGLLYGIVTAPFFENCKTEADKISAIEDLDRETGNFLLKEINEINTDSFSEDEKKN